MVLSVITLNIVGIVATLLALIGSSMVACCKYDRGGFTAYMVLCIVSLVIQVAALILFFILVEGAIIVGLIASAWPLIMRILGIVYGAKGRGGAYEGGDDGGVAQGQAA